MEGTTMTALWITPLYAATAALVFVALSVRVVRFRRVSRVSVGDAGDEELARRVRAHGNFAEYVPMALILMLLLETGGAANWLIHAMSATLLVGRLAHAWAMTARSGAGRIAGMALTFAVLIVGAVRCLWLAIGATG